MKKTNTILPHKAKLLLSASLLALSLGSLPTTAQAQCTQTTMVPVNHTLTQTRIEYCDDYQNTNIGQYDPLTGITGLHARCATPEYSGTVPGRQGVSRTCRWTTQEPQTVEVPCGDGDGDSHGYEDTDGDNQGDTPSQSDNGHHPTTDFGDGSSGGGRVICTHFFLNKEISKDYYYADFEYTLTKIHPNTVKGYHFWAVPYVEKMYQNPNGLLTKIIRPVAIHRAKELAYKMGVRSKPDYLGKFFRLLIEPACFVLGTFVKPSDYTKLYSKKYLKYAAHQYTKYRLKCTNQLWRQSDPTAMIT